MWYPGWDSGTQKGIRKKRGNVNKAWTSVNRVSILVH